MTRAEAPAMPEALATIVDALEEDIVLGRIAPRSRLIEDELIERFGCKRHVAREALARLEQMGLVERPRNIGALVRSFSPDEVHDLYALRVLLECEAARRIPLPIEARDLAQLSQIQARHDRAVERADLRMVFRSNLAFHRALFALAGNAALTEAIEEYARRTHAIRFASLAAPASRESARRDHQAILAALAQGDRAALVRLCRRHLSPSRDAYLRSLPASTSPRQPSSIGGNSSAISRRPASRLAL